MTNGAFGHLSSFLVDFHDGVKNNGSPEVQNCYLSFSRKYPPMLKPLFILIRLTKEIEISFYNKTYLKFKIQKLEIILKMKFLKNKQFDKIFVLSSFQKSKIKNQV